LAKNLPVFYNANYKVFKQLL